MIESAFEADERKRRQKDAEATLRKSIGVQDEQGRQLHGHERTLEARKQRDEHKDTEQKPEPPAPKVPVAQNLREQMKQAAAVPPKDAAKPAAAPVAVQGITSFVVNAPHKADVRGGAVALTIAPSPAIGGADAASTPPSPWQPVPGVTPNTAIIEQFATLLKTNLFDKWTITDFADEFTLVEDDLMYLQLDYDASELLTTVTLKGGTVGGGDWPDYPDIMHRTGTGVPGDPFLVDHTYFPIALVKLATDAATPAGVMTLTDGSDVLKVIQLVFGSLCIVTININGSVFDYIQPSTRTY